MPSERLAIAHVSPYAWEAETELGAHVRRVAEELSARGHRVLVIAPSSSAELVRDSRRALRGEVEALLDSASTSPRVLGVGEVLPFRTGGRRAASLPVDIARTIEDALARLGLDVVHVHDPFAPSASSVALRTSRSLTVATFHSPSERVLAGQLRPLTQLLLGRLDARVASYAATRALLEQFLPGDYQVILPAADPAADGCASGTPPSRRGAATDAAGPRIAFVAEEERIALRAFLRALRTLPADSPWQATVWSPRPLAVAARLSRRLQQRVTFVDGDASSWPAALADADVVALASEGARPTPGVLVQALADGVVPVASGLPVYDELLAQGGNGLLFAPGDTETLAAHLNRLLVEPSLLAELRGRAAAAGAQLSYRRLGDELEQLYGSLVARRHDHRPRDQAARRAVTGRPPVNVDLHMHTDHSYDCATPVELLLQTARARGLGAIAVTEHNEISGALEARSKADGIKVIVGEEIKTAEQGEVIGLFIEERIPPGLSLRETIAEIRRQGGLVYVPHPFDRMHTVPDYGHLRDVLDEIDVIEVFNPRVAIAEFNAEAVRFAARYRVIAGAGSDAHVPQGLGSVRIRMRDFDGPGQFLESLRDADIIRDPASLFYVQALKFLQTKALLPGARRASRERRLRRVARNS